MPVTINFGRVGIYSEKFSSRKAPDPLITRSIATYLDKVVTYYMKLQPIKSHNLWTSGDIRWHNKWNIFFLLYNLYV